MQEILAARIALVGEISQLNAVQLQNTQKFSGNQIDLLRCAAQAEREPGSEPNANLEQELAEANDREAELKSQISDCENQIQCLEREIDALDRELEELQNQEA